MAVRYKDRTTGKYVTRETWARSRGRTGRYVRVTEKYDTGKKKGGKRLPPYKPPIKSGPGTERFRYTEADRARQRDIEIISENGRVVSVQIGRRIYTHESDFVMLQGLVDAARVEGVEISEKQFNARNRPTPRS